VINFLSVAAYVRFNRLERSAVRRV
jgi:hypothetical protein